MKRVRNRARRTSPAAEPLWTGLIFCKLFSDVVTENLCLLRKKELNRNGLFSCNGCPIESVNFSAEESKEELPDKGGRREQ